MYVDKRRLILLKGSKMTLRKLLCLLQEKVTPSNLEKEVKVEQVDTHNSWVYKSAASVYEDEDGLIIRSDYIVYPNELDRM